MESATTPQRPNWSSECSTPPRSKLCWPSWPSWPSPVNVTAHPLEGAPSGSQEQLRSLGVQRVTFGPLLMKALTGDLTAAVSAWR